MARAVRPKPTPADVLAQGWRHPVAARVRGGLVAAFGLAMVIALISYNAADPSLNAASPALPTNALGPPGATAADIGIQSLGLASALIALTIVVLGLSRAASPHPGSTRRQLRLRGLIGLLGALALAAALAWPAPPTAWPLARQVERTTPFASSETHIPASRDRTPPIENHSGSLPIAN